MLTQDPKNALVQDQSPSSNLDLLDITAPHEPTTGNGVSFAGEKPTPKQERFPLKIGTFSKTFRVRGINSIGTRLFLSVMGSALVGLGGLSLFIYNTLLADGKRNISDQVNEQVAELEASLEVIEQHVTLLGSAVNFLKSQKITSPQVYQDLAFQYFLEMPEAAFGLGFGQTPRGITPQRQWFFPYYYYDQEVPGQIGTRLNAPYSNVFYSELSSDNDSTAYYTQSYYLTPVETQKELWVEPYASYGALIATYATPIFDKVQKTLLGITNIDINLETLGKNLSESEVVEGAGYFILISANDRLIFYPPAPPNLPPEGEEMPLANTVPDLGRLLPLLAGNEGLLEDRETDSFWAYKRMKGTNWLLIANVPRSVVLRPVLFSTISGTLITGILLSVVVIIFVRWLNKRLQPILDECSKLAQADEAMVEQLAGEDEISRLSSSFFNLLEAQNRILDRQQAEAKRAELLERIARLRQEEEVLPLIQQVLEDMRQTLGVDRVSFQRIHANNNPPAKVVAEAVGSQAPELLGKDLGTLTQTLLDLSLS